MAGAGGDARRSRSRALGASLRASRPRADHRAARRARRSHGVDRGSSHLRVARRATRTSPPRWPRRRSVSSTRGSARIAMGWGPRPVPPRRSGWGRRCSRSLAEASRDRTRTSIARAQLLADVPRRGQRGAPIELWGGGAAGDDASERDDRRIAERPLVPASASMPKGGLEPPRACAHWLLKPARLPVPPLRQEVKT